MKKFVFKLPIIIFFSFLLGLCFCTTNIPYNPVRAPMKDHTVELRNADKLTQKFQGKNVFGIHIGILSDYELHTSGIVKISLSNENNQCEKYISLRDLRNKSWHDIKIPFSISEIRKISDKYYNLTFEMINFGNNDKLIFLLNDNPQRIKTYPVVINSNTLDGSTLQFSYSFLNVELFLLFSILCFIALITCKTIFCSDKVRVFIKNNFILTGYFLLIIISILKYYHVITDYKEGWKSAPYLVNYHDAGFVSKALPGTILRLITDNVSGHLLICIYITIALVAITLVGWFLNFVLKNTALNYKKTISLVLVFYLIWPMNILGYFTSGSIGRVDLILLICFLISLILIKTQKIFCLYAISLFSIIAILCHQLYVFTYYPFIFLLLTYFTITNFKNYWKILIFNILAPALVTIKIQFFGTPSVEFNELISLINSHSLVPVLDTAVWADHYMPTAENIYVFGFLDRQLGKNLQYFVFGLLLLLPYFIILLDLLKKVYLQSTYKKLFILATFCPVIAVLPMYISISDYGRIILEQFNGLYFTILLLVMLFPDLWLTSIKDLVTSIYHKYGYASLILFFYPIVLGRIAIWAIFPDVGKNIVEQINNLSIHVFNVL
ncbi:MAG: hypothetical protein ACI4ND_04980 [Succinivibrio sp.]